MTTLNVRHSTDDGGSKRKASVFDRPVELRSVPTVDSVMNAVESLDKKIEYEFQRRTNAAETARNINVGFGEGTANERTVRFWFKRFRDGNFDLKSDPRGKPPTVTSFAGSLRTLHCGHHSLRKLAQAASKAYPVCLWPFIYLTSCILFTMLTRLYLGK